MRLRSMSATAGRKVIVRLGLAALITTILFVVGFTAAVLLSAGEMTVDLPQGMTPESFVTDDANIEIIGQTPDGRQLLVRAHASGHAELTGPDGTAIELYILPGRILYDTNNGEFSGSHPAVLILQIYTLVLTVLLTASFIVRVRVELFSYTTLYYGGAALFMSCISAALLLMVYFIYGAPDKLTMLQVYGLLCDAGTTFMLLSLPLMAVFAVGLAVSNLVLIRHEGISFPKVLGLLSSVLIAGGYMLMFCLHDAAMMNDFTYVRVFYTVFSVFTTCYVYCETMLLSAVICGIRAAKHKPAFDKTHVIILGCSIGKDGKPLPLLRGRIDCAIAFAQEQERATGRQVIFVPSGGKGSDECIAEGVSMRQYLIEQGIPESRILTEDKSATTRENLRFSYALIREQTEEPKLLFSTTNYHVLRSGILARNEGLDADGIGSRTKWYFWPNAFIREFVGLLASKRRQHLFWLTAGIFFFALLNALLLL